MSIMHAPVMQETDSSTRFGAKGMADTVTDDRAESGCPVHIVQNKHNAADAAFQLPCCTYTGRKPIQTCGEDVAGDGLETAGATVLPWAVCEAGPDSPAGC